MAIWNYYYDSCNVLPENGFPQQTTMSCHHADHKTKQVLSCQATSFFFLFPQIIFTAFEYLIATFFLSSFSGFHSQCNEKQKDNRHSSTRGCVQCIKPIFASSLYGRWKKIILSMHIRWLHLLGICKTRYLYVLQTLWWKDMAW